MICSSPARWVVHHFDMKSGELHPLSSIAETWFIEIPAPILEECTRCRIQAYGDLIGLLVQFWDGNGGCQLDIRVWNWKSGSVILVRPTHLELVMRLPLLTNDTHGWDSKTRISNPLSIFGTHLYIIHSPFLVKTTSFSRDPKPL